MKKNPVDKLIIKYRVSSLNYINMKEIDWSRREEKSLSDIASLRNVIKSWNPSDIMIRRKSIKDLVWPLVITSSHLISPIGKDSKERHQSFIDWRLASGTQFTIWSDKIASWIVQWQNTINFFWITTSEDLSNEILRIPKRLRERIYYNLMIWNYTLVAARKWLEKSKLTKGQIKDTYLIWVTANWINKNVEMLIDSLKNLRKHHQRFTIAQTMISSVFAWVVAREWMRAWYTTISNACAWMYSWIIRSAERIMCWDDMVAISVFDSFRHFFALATTNIMWAVGQNSTPFDKWAIWMVPSEAAWFYMLERGEVAAKRWVDIGLEVCWWSEASDAKESILRPVSETQAKWMLEAIFMAWINPEDIDWVVAHWTSTSIGDTVEAIALQTVFWDHKKNVTILAPKSNTWHPLAASWALSLECAYTALKYWISPKHLGLNDPIPEVGWFDLAKWGKKQFKYILLNSLWFWWVNSFLVVKLGS